MSSHPGSTLNDAVELAEYLRDSHCRPEQVQDFYPTPSTVSTCMYYTGLDPRTMQPVYVARSPHEKAMQRALVQYREPGNYRLVKEALLQAGRADLIGYGRDCLIPPRPYRDKAARDPSRPPMAAGAKAAPRGKRAAQGGRSPEGSTKGGSTKGGRCPGQRDKKRRRPG